MRRYLGWTLAIAALLLYLFGSQIITLLTDFLWFGELGYRSVMVTSLRTQLMLGGVLGLLFFVIVYSNLWIARRWAPPVPRGYQELDLGERISVFARRSVDILLLVGSLVLAVLASFEAASHWQQFLLWASPVAFGTKDPLFGRDIGFYVFQLPFIHYLYRWLLFALFAAFLGTAWVHYTDRALLFASNIPIPRFAPHVKVHLSILLSFILFVFSYGYWLKRYTLLQSDFGLLNLNGAGYTDVHSRLIAFSLMALGCIVVGLLLLINLGHRGGGLNLPAIGLAGLFGLSVLVGVLYPAFVQAYVVGPNDAQLELPYIKSNIDFTRSGYQLDKIDIQPYEANAPLTAEDLKSQQPTLQNIRLWDYRVLKRVYVQQQGLKPYYNFNDVDIVRYHFKSGYQQVMIAPRELNVAQLPQKTWVSQRLQYTHGYGVVMSPVNGVSSEGSPQYLIKDMPPQPVDALKDELKITRPEIYFGSEDNGYALVDTEQPEFDYPSSAGEKQTKYGGAAGIPVGAYFRKLMFGMRYGDTQLILSKLLGPDAKILIHRAVQDRVATLAPFLLQDRDPYLVIAGGRLVWMLDCYTTTDMYPYSQPLDSGTNYLRNSVKVTVDAYDGSTNLYVFDPNDPIIRAYEKIFPKLFRPASAMPAALKAQIRYPEDLFSVQTMLYNRYHMNDPQVFYTQSDAWDLANEGGNSGDEPQPMEPYYVTMKLPGSDDPEFILIRPFTPKGKANLAAWMAVRCDPQGYGKAIVYKFSQTSLTQGPAQIEARIQQDPEISRNVSLWNTQGSRIQWGNLLVFPMDKSLLYVQPLYLQAEQGGAQMPELRRVIVATDQPQRIAMSETLGGALNEVLGGTVASGPDNGPDLSQNGASKPSTSSVPLSTGASGITPLIRQANQQMDAAEAAQRSGDWAGYGKAINALRQTLRTLSAQAPKASAKG